MKITIDINTDSAAFDAPNFYGELSDVLAQIPVMLERGTSSRKLCDYNGNTVGTFDIVEQ